MSDRTTIGDRMKSYEAPSTTRKAFKGQPLIVRLDGSSFHKFTKGMKRPFDLVLSQLMIDTMKSMVERYNANIGYTQSDEITLAWYMEPFESRELEFGGRFQKFESELAAWCSVKFNSLLRETEYAKKAEMLPYFDARAFVVPNLTEAMHCFLWRQQDCTKNAISMAAQSMFSHKELQGKHGPEMQEMMFQKFNVNFNDYPSHFKRGTFARRVKREWFPSDAEIEAIPEKYRPSGPILRSFVQTEDIWLSKQPSGTQALFGDAPIVTNVTVS
jgi:tRNA(His) 5'-end guanylyltransferase